MAVGGVPAAEIAAGAVGLASHGKRHLCDAACGLPPPTGPLKDYVRFVRDA